MFEDFVIDLPQKDQAYKESKHKMEKQKEKLIKSNHVIKVKVKPKKCTMSGEELRVN